MICRSSPQYLTIRERVRRRRRERELTRQGAYRGVKPVPLPWANRYREARHLPQPGDPTVLGLEPPVHAGDCTRYLLPDGTAWEYLGFTGYACDSKETWIGDRLVQVNGWRDITYDLSSNP